MSTICAICGGLTRVEYTIVFEQRQPVSMRVEPASSLPLCPGHDVGMSSTEDWHKLNNEQKYDVDLLRQRIGDYLIEQAEAFYKQHPELRLTWSMTLDALIGKVDIQEL